LIDFLIRTNTEYIGWLSTWNCQAGNGTYL